MLRVLLFTNVVLSCLGKLYDYELEDPFDDVHNFGGEPFQYDHLDELFFDDDDDYLFDRNFDHNDELADTDSVVSLDINPDGACKEDLIVHSHCVGSSKAVCLWMDNVDSVRWSNHVVGYYKPVSSACKTELVEFLTNASNHPFKYFHHLQNDCAVDISQICHNTTMEQTALGCLRANFDSITDSTCRDEIVHFNSWTSMNETWWSPTLWHDCSEERTSVCTNRTSTGLTDFRDCLDDNRSSLSLKCHRSLFQSDMQAAPNPFLLRRDVSMKCVAETKRYCNDVSPKDENHLFCLFRASKRPGTNFDTDCIDSVDSVVTLIESDYRMNVPMRKFCRRTIDEFCPNEKQKNDESGIEDDSVIVCLKRVFLFSEHRVVAHNEAPDWERAEETDACMNVIRQSVLISSLDWEADSDLHTNCLLDYHRLLHRVDNTVSGALRDAEKCDKSFSPNDCLQSHIHDLEDPECVRAVMLHSQLSALDVDFQPQLLEACALALDHLDCGEDLPVSCLYTNLNTISDQHCREAIRHDYELSDRDYRLSYSLTLVCETDRLAHCGSVPATDVARCMIEHVESISDPACEKDVSRLAFVAQTEGEESLEQLCANDVKKFCDSIQTGHGNVHACLINQIEFLSPMCSEEILNLHRSASSFKSMEMALNSACSHELVAACKHLTTVGTKTLLSEKAQCLYEHLRSGDEVEFSRECESQLTTVNTLLSMDYRTNPALQKDCGTDVELLCGTGGMSSKTIQCLISHRLQIRNTNCKSHIVSTIYKMSENVQFVPNMRRVCGDDIRKFCSLVPVGGGSLHECLRENFEELSHDCQSQEFTIEQLESLSAVTVNACKSEQMCGGSDADLHCLWRNVDDVSVECAKAVKSEMKGKFGNIWLDPTLYTRCRDSVNDFIDSDEPGCPDWLQTLPVPLNGLIPLPSNYTQAIGGEHIVCLGTNRAKIADRSCLSLVENILRMEASDPILFKFGLRSACRRDLNGGICANADPFNTISQWRCLQDNVDSVASACANGVKRVWRMSLIDVQFNPDITANCETEISNYCKNLVKGGTRTIACLSETFTRSSNNTDIVFSEECAEAVKRLPKAESLDLANPWNIAKKQAKSILDSVSKNDTEIPEIQHARLLQATTADISSIAISGPLAMVSLAALFLVVVGALYRLFKYKMNKGYMVIVEKD